MKEQIYLNLGEKELISIVIRNGLFSGSWSRMKQELKTGGLHLPGITVETVSSVESVEKKYQLNLNRVIFKGIPFPSIKTKNYRERRYAVYRICYLACRGLFSYPCVASENRVTHEYPGHTLHRTYLARPMYSYPASFDSPIYQGVNRMKMNPSQYPESTGGAHEKLFEQLNKMRECNPCDEQSTCMDHKFVMEATEVVIREYHLENSFVGKLLARSLCWMAAEESRLMRLIEKEGMMIDPPGLFPTGDEEDIQEEFFPNSDAEGFFGENSETPGMPAEPHPLLDVIHDLRESVRDTVRLLSQMNKAEK